MPLYYPRYNNDTATPTASTIYWPVQQTTATTSSGSLWMQYLDSRSQLTSWDAGNILTSSQMMWPTSYHRLVAATRERLYAAPAVITRQDQAHIDEQAYRRAVAEHDEQEATRLLRIVEQHARTNEERLRLIEQQRATQAEDQQRRAAASERAKQLLRENLTPQQLETFDRNGWFVVEGGRTKQKYRIRSGTMVANVDVIDKGERTMHRLCGHVPLGQVPHGDQLLAQKIMIELAEDDFLRVANRHRA